MRSYHRLVAWRASHDLCIDTLRVCDGSYHPRAAAVIGQLRRAVVSIETNIVEGYALRTRPLFRRHIRIALGSAVETERLLSICSELGYFPHRSVTPLLRTADRTVALLYRLLESLGRP